MRKLHITGARDAHPRTGWEYLRWPRIRWPFVIGQPARIRQPDIAAFLPRSRARAGPIPSGATRAIPHGCPLLAAESRDRASTRENARAGLYVRRSPCVLRIRRKLKILEIPLMRRNVITCLLNARVIRFRRRAAKVTAKRRAIARARSLPSSPPTPVHPVSPLSRLVVFARARTSLFARAARPFYRLGAEFVRRGRIRCVLNKRATPAANNADPMPGFIGGTGMRIDQRVQASAETCKRSELGGVYIEARIYRIAGAFQSDV